MILLFPSPPTEVAQKLGADARVQLTSGRIAANSGFGILHHGIALTLTIGGAHDLAGYKQIFCNIDAGSVGSSVAIALGDHVQGGGKVAAIVRELLGAGKLIGEICRASAIVWQPAKTVSGFEYLAQAVGEYANGGAFPVIALINFQSDSSGEIHSTGLSWLSGQELSVVPSGLSESEAMRRVVRVAHDIAVNGPVSSDVDLEGIETGETVELRPVDDIVTLQIVSDSTQ